MHVINVSKKLEEYLGNRILHFNVKYINHMFSSIWHVEWVDDLELAFKFTGKKPIIIMHVYYLFYDNFFN